MKPVLKPDVAIIGAGAAGLMCAMTAARHGRKVVVLEHNARPCEKVLISGGGRCNFTNLNISADNYVSENAHFVKSAIARFTREDFVALLGRHNIPHIEKECGRLFCRNSARQIADMLIRECISRGVDIRINTRILSVSKRARFIIYANSETIESSALVIATGGLSYPKLGASHLGMKIARQFGLAVTECRPALVPLTLNSHDLALIKGLSGISLCAKISCDDKTFSGGLIFTHRGLSGPAILDASLVWASGKRIIIDLIPDTDIHAKFRELKKSAARATPKTILSRHVPARFAERWCDTHAPSRPIKSFTPGELSKIAHGLKNWEIIPAGTEGYGKAEVTRGGVDTREISSKTMESRKIPGLYFIGEVLDVAGQLGGYNLQWAWSSGYAAGKNLRDPSTPPLDNSKASLRAGEGRGTKRPKMDDQGCHSGVP